MAANHSNSQSIQDCVCLLFSTTAYGLLNELDCVSQYCRPDLKVHSLDECEKLTDGIIRLQRLKQFELEFASSLFACACLRSKSV